MFKNMIAPVQAWLLSQQRCVGCGTPLNLGTKNNVQGQTMVTCKCFRVYIFDEAKKIYRRALLSEV